MKANFAEVRSHGYRLGYMFYYQNGSEMATEFDDEGVKCFETMEEARKAARKFKKRLQKTT